MKVAEWVQRHPGGIVTVAPELSIDDLLERMLSGPCLRDLYVVDDGGKLVGHISHRRLARLALSHHTPFHTRRQIVERVAAGSARELMRRSFATAHPEEELDDVVHRQLEHDVEDMPVIADDDTLLGALNLTEILRAVRRGELNERE